MMEIIGEIIQLHVEHFCGIYVKMCYGEKRQEDALKGHFTNRQKRKEVPWPDILADFENWEPKKRRA